MAEVDKSKKLQISIRDIRSMTDEEFEKLTEDTEIIVEEVTAATTVQKETSAVKEVKMDEQKEKANEVQESENEEAEEDEEIREKEEPAKTKKTRKTKENQEDEKTPVMTRNMIKTHMMDLPPGATISDHLKQLRHLTSNLGMPKNEEGAQFLLRYKEVTKNSIAAIKNQHNTYMRRIEELEKEVEDLQNKTTRQNTVGMSQRERQSAKRIKDLEKSNANYHLEINHWKNLIDKLREELATEKAKCNQEYIEDLKKEHVQQKKVIEEEVAKLKEKVKSLETTDQSIIYSKILDRLDSLEGKKEVEKPAVQTEKKKKISSYSEALKKKTIVITPTDGRKTGKISEALAKISTGSVNAENIITKDNVIIVKAKTEEDATEISKLMTTAGEEAGFQVQRRGPRKTRIVVHNVPRSIQPPEVIEEICEKLNTTEQKHIRYLWAYPSRKREDARHIVLLLPEVMAGQLVRPTPRESFICIGVTKLYMAPYAVPERCRNCCGFDHREQQCTFRTYCAVCMGCHDSRGCQRRAKCTNCSLDNLEHTDHPAFSKSCPVYISHQNSQIDEFARRIFAADHQWKRTK